jgi:hypothetical protein
LWRVWGWSAGLGDTGRMNQVYDTPTAILPDALWISGCPIDYSWLRQRRIDLVVDVADPELLLEQDRLGSVVYCKEALVDGPELPAETITDRLVRDVVVAVREGKRVLVACAGGRNRSGLIVALAVRELLCCSGAEAVQLVQSLRENAINNVTFAGHLASLPRPERIDAGRAASVPRPERIDAGQAASVPRPEKIESGQAASVGVPKAT